MNDSELVSYFEMRKKQLTEPDFFTIIEQLTNKILKAEQLTFSHRLLSIISFELLCLTIHTHKGRTMYIELLTRIAPFFPEMAEKYWIIFDNQEDLMERYRFPKENEKTHI